MYYPTLGLHFGDSVSRSMGVLDIKRSLLWSVAKFRLPSKHVLTICHWNPCSHNTFGLCLVIWHVYIVVIAPVTQRLACVNQGCHKSRCEGDVELSGRIGLESLSSVSFLREPPFSYSVETSLIIAVSLWLCCPHFNHCDEEEVEAGQWLSLSAHSCLLVCSVWGTDNFHWDDWVQDQISCSMCSGHSRALVSITNWCCGACKWS